MDAWLQFESFAILRHASLSLLFPPDCFIILDSSPGESQYIMARSRLIRAASSDRLCPSCQERAPRTSHISLDPYLAKR